VSKRAVACTGLVGEAGLAGMKSLLTAKRKRIAKKCFINKEQG
jgi:hypothetical protein